MAEIQERLRERLIELVLIGTLGLLAFLIVGLMLSGCVLPK